MLTSLLDNNRLLLETAVDDTVVEAFVRKLMSAGQDKDDIELLMSLCEVPTGPVPRQQVRCLRFQHRYHMNALLTSR